MLKTLLVISTLGALSTCSDSPFTQPYNAIACAPLEGGAKVCQTIICDSTGKVCTPLVPEIAKAAP